MSTRYLIGRAELLTYPIEAPKKKNGDKAHPYTLGEAQRIIVPEIEVANTIFQALPAKACADDLAVARGKFRNDGGRPDIEAVLRCEAIRLRVHGGPVHNERQRPARLGAQKNIFRHRQILGQIEFLEDH